MIKLIEVAFLALGTLFGYKLHGFIYRRKLESAVFKVLSSDEFNEYLKKEGGNDELH